MRHFVRLLLVYTTVRRVLHCISGPNRQILTLTFPSLFTSFLIIFHGFCVFIVLMIFITELRVWWLCRVLTLLLLCRGLWQCLKVYAHLQSVLSTTPLCECYGGCQSNRTDQSAPTCCSLITWQLTHVPRGRHTTTWVVCDPTQSTAFRSHYCSQR